MDREEISTLSGEELLERFLRSRDEQAFRELVSQNLPIVMGVCRRVLGNETDAEDAFQATFIILARKAPQIHRRESVSSWLYGVAFRTAKRMAKKRVRLREEALVDEPTTEGDVLSQIADQYQLSQLENELQMLPTKLREAIVLRYLMGRTNSQVAADVGVTERTVERRLENARRQLKIRLLTCGTGSAVLASLPCLATTCKAASQTSLVDATVAAGLQLGGGTGAFNHDVLRLAQEELSMSSFRCSTTSVVAVVAGVIGPLSLMALLLCGSLGAVAAEDKAITIEAQSESSREREQGVPVQVVTKGEGDVEASVPGIPGANDFIKLAKEFDTQIQEFFKKAISLEDDSERAAALAKLYAAEPPEPAGGVLSELLAFEKEHRGQLVGLMALRKVFRYAAQTGSPSDALRKAKRAGLQRLIAYSALPECSQALRRLASGGYHEPAVEDCLRRISKSKKAQPNVRAAAKYHLAYWMLNMRGIRGLAKSRDSVEAQIEKLQANSEPKAFIMAKMLQAQLAVMPDAATLSRWKKEAIESLNELIECGSDLRLPKFRNVDPGYHIICVDEDKTKSAPTLSELASALLMKELHLSVGAMAPDLSATLVNGDKWSLAQQRGKVVVIQFSFTGCHPCKLMYPTMAELHNDHGESVAMLTIMRDDDVATTTATISSSRISWDVSWDREAKATESWAVRGFPTVYVIDQDGRVAANAVSNETLASTVGKLVR